MPKRRLIRTAGVLALLAAAACLVLWRLTWAAPSWYRPAEANDTAAATLAEAVENRLAEEAHKVRVEPDPWTLRVRGGQVNAWLSTRLSRWLVHEQEVQWPEQLGVPQVRVEREGVDVAIVIAPEGDRRVLVLRIVPRVEQNRLYLPFNGLSLGRVAMPGYTLDDLLELAARHGAEEILQDPQVNWLLDVLRGDASLEPTATLADDRRVQLLNVQLGDGYVDLTMQTLPPADDDG